MFYDWDDFVQIIIPLFPFVLLDKCSVYNNNIFKYIVLNIYNSSSDVYQEKYLELELTL